MNPDSTLYSLPCCLGNGGHLKILFLDEATSSLDLEREAAINKAIRRLKITRIIVAHRPGTLRYADRVLVLSTRGIREASRSENGLMMPVGSEGAVESSATRRE